MGNAQNYRFPYRLENSRGRKRGEDIVYIPRRGNVMLPPYARYVPASHIPAADAVHDFMNGRPALVKSYRRAGTRGGQLVPVDSDNCERPSGDQRAKRADISLLAY